MKTARRQANAGRGWPRDPAAEKAILRAALELFVERGIEGASFEQIARRAGVARTTVYRRWSSREDLVGGGRLRLQSKLKPKGRRETRA